MSEISDLQNHQDKFFRLTALLIAKAAELYPAKDGYRLGWGEALRTPEQAQWNHDHGLGTLNTLHRDRLALDIEIRKDGVPVNKGFIYKPLGDYWESLDPACSWGGDFMDIYHFSLAYGGRR